MQYNVQNVISKVYAGELRCDKAHGDNVTNSRVVVVPPDGKSLLSKYLVAKKAKCLRAIWNFFVGDILAIHHSDSALTVDVLMARIDNLSETSS